MTVAVILPAYQAETTIVACLHALTRQDYDQPYDILVVDSSTDATPELIRRHFPQVRLIHLAQQTDPGTARNLGVQQSAADLLCFLDADCLAPSDWLRRMTAAHEAQPEYAAVGGAIGNGNPENLIGWAGYLAEFREFFPFQPKQVTRHAATCNISYKRAVFERYGGFPAEFYPQEDLVFHLRLYRDRVPILFDPTICVAHLNKTTLRAFLRHQYQIGRITAEVLKHFPALTGGTFASFPLLALCASPFLPFVKFLQTFRVAARAQTYRRHFIALTPLLLFGLLIWDAGFLRGVFAPRRFPRNTKPLIRLDYPVRWELERWALHGLTLIPGELGVFLRKWLIPFRLRGDNFRIMEQVWIERPQNLSIGENCRLNRGVYINAVGGVDIGSNVGIGPGALIYSLNHNFRTKDTLYMDQGYTPARVVLEDDVWIAAQATILPGVTVKQGTIVAAGAVVTRDTEPYSIVAGVPAKVIGYRT